jgi:hypothetical protein
VKKLKSLGKSLNRNEMKKIHGGKGPHQHCTGSCDPHSGDFYCNGPVYEPICSCYRINSIGVCSGAWDDPR